MQQKFIQIYIHKRKAWNTIRLPFCSKKKLNTRFKN